MLYSQIGRVSAPRLLYSTTFERLFCNLFEVFGEEYGQVVQLLPV